MSRIMRVSARTLVIINLCILGLAILFLALAYMTRKESQFVNLKQETLAPLYPLNIWPTLEPPKKPTESEPMIIYYVTPTTTTQSSSASSISPESGKDPSTSQSSTTLKTTTGSTMYDPSKLTTTKPEETIDEREYANVSLAIIEDERDSNDALFMLAVGIDKINHPSSQYARRFQQPVKSKNRVSLLANEPSDMFEYISRHFQVYDFHSLPQVQQCSFPYNFSFPLYQTVGGLLEGHPVLCGGLTRYQRHVDKCYIFKDEQWQILLDLNKAATSHSGVVLENVLYLQNGKELMTIKASGDLEILDQLPFTTSSSCMVALNISTLALIGGLNASGHANFMLIYHLNTGIWSYGPPLKQKRSNAACATFLNDEDKITLIVAGGMDGMLKLASTELLIDGNAHWQPGPDLPRSVKDTSILRLHNKHDLIMIGGMGNVAGIWHLKLHNNTWTKRYPVHVPKSLFKASPVVMPIPKGLASDCHQVDRGNVLLYETADKMGMMYKLLFLRPLKYYYYVMSGVTQAERPWSGEWGFTSGDENIIEAAAAEQARNSINAQTPGNHLQSDIPNCGHAGVHHCRMVFILRHVAINTTILDAYNITNLISWYENPYLELAEVDFNVADFPSYYRNTIYEN